MNGWFIQVGSETLGPYSPEEIKAKAASGEIRVDTLVRAARNPDWSRAEKFAFLQFTAPPPLEPLPTSLPALMPEGSIPMRKSRVGLIGAVGIIVVASLALALEAIDASRPSHQAAPTNNRIAVDSLPRSPRTTPSTIVQARVPQVTSSPLRVQPQSQTERQELERRKNDALLEEMIARTKRQLAEVRNKLIEESRQLELILIKKSKADPLDRALGIAYIHGSTSGERSANRKAVIAELYRTAYDYFDADDMPEARRTFDEIQRHINGYHDQQVPFRQKLAELGVKTDGPTLAQQLGEKAFKDRIQLERRYQQKLLNEP